MLIELSPSMIGTFEGLLKSHLRAMREARDNASTDERRQYFADAVRSTHRDMTELKIAFEKAVAA